MALQSDQPRAGRLGDRPGDLGLADAGFTLEQQRLLKGGRKRDRERQRAVGEVSAGGECGARRLDGSEIVG